MTYCSDCIHHKVCGNEGVDDVSMTFCADKQPRWIPVNEKLPNFNDIVLASVIDDNIGLRVIIINYRREEFWFNGRITAWMPLPEPYKAESEENK